MHDAEDASRPPDAFFPVPDRYREGDPPHPDTPDRAVPTREQQLARLEQERREAWEAMSRPPGTFGDLGVADLQRLLSARLQHTLGTEAAMEQLREDLLPEEVERSRPGSVRANGALPYGECFARHMDPTTQWCFDRARRWGLQCVRRRSRRAR